MGFVFFGLVATAGTSYVMVRTVPAAAWWCGSAIGLLAVAILEANNVRDIATDERAGKRTLAVRIGDRAARNLYAALMIAPFVTIVLGFLVYLLSHAVGLTPWGLVGLAGWFLAIGPIEASRTATGPDLIPVLVGTAKLHAATGLLLALGLVLAQTVT
jgi:1,4-dihydroxy-2-naphthoate octaprenyltransferase